VNFQPEAFNRFENVHTNVPYDGPREAFCCFSIFHGLFQASGVPSMEVTTIRIIDATLREGVQAPRTRLSREQTIEIAECLADAGVDMIECGHPSASDNEHRRLKAIVDRDNLPPILAHARCCEKDIDAVAGTGAPWVGLFLGISKISQLTRLRKSREQLIELVGNSVAFAKAQGLRVRYSLEDGSRTDWETAKAAYTAARDAGVDRICFTDSVGLLEPRDSEIWVDRIKQQFPDTPLEVHFHDDRGLALANTLAAVDAGCDWISTSVNGIGERCGITDLIALSANLLFREQRPVEHPEQLQQLSHLVEIISCSPVDHRRPITGRNAFTHTAKLHVDAMKRDSRAYTWIDPTKVGRSQVLEDSSLSSINSKEASGTQICTTRRGFNRILPSPDYDSEHDGGNHSSTCSRAGYDPLPRASDRST